jgi:hypothetical protein
LAAGAVALVAPALVAACGGGEEGVAELRIGAGGPASTGDAEYRFALPDSVPAGRTRMTLANDGAEAHQAQLFHLHEDAAVEDLLDALARGGPPAALETGEYVGGTAMVAPGERSRADAVVDLAPGDYVLLCLIPAPDGRPHVAHGMLHPFSATGSPGDLPVPRPDGSVGLRDYRFDVPAAVEGDALLELTNRSAAEPHELMVTRVEDGVTAEDVGRALAEGSAPPATPLGGMQAILPGASQRLQLDLDPGRYVLVCEVPSPDGVDHHRKGMITELTVT